MNYIPERPRYSPIKKPISYNPKSFNILYEEEKDKMLEYINPAISIFIGIMCTFIIALVLRQIF